MSAPIPKSKLHENLVYLKTVRKVSESELARQTGIGQPVVHRLLSGETSNPKVETLRPIAHFFSLTLGQLMGDEALPPHSHSDKKAITFKLWQYIPLLSFEQALLWPESLKTHDIEHYVATDADVDKSAYALKVQDHAMSPLFPQHTVLIIDPRYQPCDGEFAIVHLDGHPKPTFKQILMDGDWVSLKPLNSDYQTHRTEGGYRFLGVVVQSRANFKPRGAQTTS